MDERVRRQKIYEESQSIRYIVAVTVLTLLLCTLGAYAGMILKENEDLKLGLIKCNPRK